jgi:hypothetical protein
VANFNAAVLFVPIKRSDQQKAVEAPNLSQKGRKHNQSDRSGEWQEIPLMRLLTSAWLAILTRAVL